MIKEQARVAQLAAFVIFSPLVSPAKKQQFPVSTSTEWLAAVDDTQADALWPQDAFADVNYTPSFSSVAGVKSHTQW